MTIADALRVRVARKETIAEDIALFELVAADGATLPAFSAGAHVDVAVPGGPVRQYSLCNAPGATAACYQIAVLREAAGRGGSRALHDRVQAGHALSISAPKNHFALADGGFSLLLAGGIGITPLLAMAEALSAAGRPFEMHYCTRSAARTAFATHIGASRFAPAVQLHHDEGAAAQRLDLPAVLQGHRAGGTHLYTCGPNGFMDAVLAAARQLAWPEERLHREYFSAAPVARADAGGFEVQIGYAGPVVRVGPDQTVVAALAAAGCHVPTSCEQGVCGTCLTRVLDGVPDHRDLYLTPAEQAANNQFLPCCSRATSPRLVLDL